MPTWLNNMNSLLDKAIAIIKRDLLSAMRYRGAFVMGAAGAIMEIAGLYYLSRAIGPGFRPDGMESYPFLLIGAGFYTFLVMGISSFVTATQDAQQAGTFEVLMSTSSSPLLIALLSAISTFLITGLTFFFYLLAGLWIVPLRLPPSNLAVCLLVFAISAGIAVAIGIAAAAVQVSVQKGSAVVWLLGSAVWLLTGALFPVSALPRFLRSVSMLIPLTHSVYAMRLAVLSGAPNAALGKEIIVLGLFCVTLLPASLALFSEALCRARLNGSLSFY
jgi:ABC-2 type transport system permease protein